MVDVTKSNTVTPVDSGRRRSLERFVFLLLPFVGALLYGLWSYHNTDSYYGDLEDYGVETQATIISKRVIRRGTDRPHFAYEMTVGFTVGDKMRQGKVQVTNDFYNRHDPPQRIPLRYLPDNPQIREIDPGIRGKSMRGAITIIGILLFVGIANIFITNRGTQRLREERDQ